MSLPRAASAFLPSRGSAFKRPQEVLGLAKVGRVQGRGREGGSLHLRDCIIFKRERGKERERKRGRKEGGERERDRKRKRERGRKDERERERERGRKEGRKREREIGRERKRKEGRERERKEGRGERERKRQEGRKEERKRDGKRKKGREGGRGRRREKEGGRPSGVASLQLGGAGFVLVVRKEGGPRAAPLLPPHPQALALHHLLSHFLLKTS
ncbi:Histone-lysine N-methyltransferase, H3 lysine-79 specific, partial [Ophiophagus hannah]